MNRTLQTCRWLLPVILGVMLNCTEVLAQTRTVSGVVKDNSTGESIPGVSVLVKNSTVGTITEGDGKYSIQVTSDADVLVFSFVGFAKKEVVVGSQSTIDLSLDMDLTTL